MSDETPKDAEVEETPEPEAAASDELEPTAADEAAADEAAAEEEDDVLTDEPEADDEPEAEADDEPEAEVDDKVDDELEADDEPEAEADDEIDDELEADEEPAAEEKPKRRRRRSRGAKEDEEAAAPAPQPARRRVAPGERVLVRAQAKYVRTSARKARLVCDHIRGKSVVEARAILALTPRHVARDWSKLLESAVANAENNHELIGDELRIASVTADEGPTLKRYRPRAMGRATRIRKRTSHLTILLTPKES
jgi:ribosomal protein L22